MWHFHVITNFVISLTAIHLLRIIVIASCDKNVRPVAPIWLAFVCHSVVQKICCDNTVARVWPRPLWWLPAALWSAAEWNVERPRSVNPLKVPVRMCWQKPLPTFVSTAEKKKKEKKIRHNRENFMLLIFIYCSIKIDFKKVTWCLLQDSASWLCQRRLVNTGPGFSFLFFSFAERIQTLWPPTSSS